MRSLMRLWASRDIEVCRYVMKPPRGKPRGGFIVHTFSWMKREVTPGDHTVKVFFFLALEEGAGGTAGSSSRTLTVEVYKP